MDSGSGGVKTTLIIPTKNEELNIREVLESAIPLVSETIVVDGHSTDRTINIAKDAGARIIMDSGRGKGDGLRIAIGEASHDIIIFMDADGSHDPQDIPRLISYLQEQNLDLVIGSRIKGGSDEWSGSFGRFIRMMGSHAVLIAINYRWGIRLTDCQNGFRAIRTSVVRSIDLRENGFAIEQEMVMKTALNGYRIGEIGCHEYERRNGRSKLNLLSVWPDILRTFFVLSLFGKPSTSQHETMRSP